MDIYTKVENIDEAIRFIYSLPFLRRSKFGVSEKKFKEVLEFVNSENMPIHLTYGGLVLDIMFFIPCGKEKVSFEAFKDAVRKPLKKRIQNA